MALSRVIQSARVIFFELDYSKLDEALKYQLDTHGQEQYAHTSISKFDDDEVTVEDQVWFYTNSQEQRRELIAKFGLATTSHVQNREMVVYALCFTRPEVVEPTISVSPPELPF